MEVSGGVPQGSVLGPIPWHILYNRVLELKLIVGITTIIYADDMVLVVKVEDTRDMMFKANESLVFCRMDEKNRCTNGPPQV